MRSAMLTLSCDLWRYNKRNNLKDVSDRFCKYFDFICGLVEETAALVIVV